MLIAEAELLDMGIIQLLEIEEVAKWVEVAKDELPKQVERPPPKISTRDNANSKPDQTDKQLSK